MLCHSCWPLGREPNWTNITVKNTLSLSILPSQDAAAAFEANFQHTLSALTEHPSCLMLVRFWSVSKCYSYHDSIFKDDWAHTIFFSHKFKSVRTNQPCSPFLPIRSHLQWQRTNLSLTLSGSDNILYCMYHSQQRHIESPCRALQVVAFKYRMVATRLLK